MYVIKNPATFRTMGLMGIVAAMPCLTVAPAVGDIMTDFADGEGDTTPNQYVGTEGDGWAGGWATFSRDNAGIMTYEQEVTNVNPITNSDNYLSVHAMKAEQGSVGEPTAGLRRQYQSYGSVDLSQRHFIQFQIRLDEMSGLNHTNDDRLEIWANQSAHGRTIRANTSTTWAMYARAYDWGGDETHKINWTFDHGDGQGGAESIVLDVDLISGAEGTTYDITVDLDPVTNTWDVLISDGNNTVLVSDHNNGHRLGFRGDAEEPGSYLHIVNNFRRTTGEKTFNYSLNSISIVPEPGTLGLLGAGALMILQRKRPNAIETST